MQGHNRSSLLSITKNKSSWRKTVAFSELTQRRPVFPRSRYKGPWKGKQILNTPGFTGSSVKEPLWMVNVGMFLLPPAFPCVDFTRLSVSLFEIFLFCSQESRLSWSPVSSQFNKDNKPARSPAPGTNCLSPEKWSATDRYKPISNQLQRKSSRSVCRLEATNVPGVRGAGWTWSGPQAS